MKHNITTRNDLLGVNGFTKLYKITRQEVQRLLDRNYLSGISIADGITARVFIDNNIFTEEAKENNMSPQDWLYTILRRSKL